MLGSLCHSLHHEESYRGSICHPKVWATFHIYAYAFAGHGKQWALAIMMWCCLPVGTCPLLNTDGCLQMK